MTYSIERYESPGDVLPETGYAVRDESGWVAYMVSDRQSIVDALAEATTDIERSMVEAVRDERDRVFTEMMARHPEAWAWE